MTTNQRLFERDMRSNGSFSAAWGWVRRAAEDYHDGPIGRAAITLLVEIELEKERLRLAKLKKD